MSRKNLWGVAALLLLTIEATNAQKGITPMRKKVISFGWHMPSPAMLRDKMRDMEKRPFDGVSIQLSEAAGKGDVFDIKRWAQTRPEDRAKELEICASIPLSDTFTDNFLVIYGASTMDWFSDADWKLVLENLRYCARAAKLAHCKGVFWDPEPYHNINPWRYEALPGHEKHTFAEYAKQARKRGAQFVRALQEEFPGIVIFSLRQLSDFQQGSPFSQKLLPVRDSSKLEHDLSQAWWGLHAPFTDGLLDGMKPDTILVDGNEDAYFYTSPLDFYRIYHVLRQEALRLISPENHRKYALQYQVGHAVSISYPMGEWAEGINFPDYLRRQGLELTPEERLKWIAHNLYYAMQTSESYVWVYNEELNWWTGEKVPAGLEETLRTTQRKFHAGEALGFSIEERLAEARAKLKAKEKPRGK